MGTPMNGITCSVSVPALRKMKGKSYKAVRTTTESVKAREYCQATRTIGTIKIGKSIQLRKMISVNGSFICSGHIDALEKIGPNVAIDNEMGKNNFFVLRSSHPQYKIPNKSKKITELDK